MSPAPRSTPPAEGWQAGANPAGRGRPAAAQPDDVLVAARRQFTAEQRIDVQAIAAELGLGRATIYRWFGSREGLIGTLLLTDCTVLFRRAEQRANDATGAHRVLQTIDGFNRKLMTNNAFRAYIELEQRAALQVLTSAAGTFQPGAVALVTALIERAVNEDGYQPPLEPATLAYALARLNEAFLYNDAVIGLSGDLDVLHDVLAALLGIPHQSR
ncbi:QsdR family transcriptional regulator [Nocardia altamirensis]|uniref:QsdR family transcriptional regulator n=1 Tax=Nocardia altamirensis TaxID=472158 RepID=UPI0009FD1CB5|nr:QsdR family transcriptional regulator [Nocardia altamirensis]